jgi:hypothetical protein
MTLDVHTWDLSLYCQEQTYAFRGQSELLSQIGHPYSASLLEWLAQSLSEGLHALDATDRGDARWTDTNMLPTHDKLRSYCQERLAVAPDAQEPARWALALCVHSWSGHIPDQLLWRLPIARTLPAAWFIEASWIEASAWGPGHSMAALARTCGLARQFQEQLEVLSHDAGDNVRRWALLELEQCR